MVSRDSIFSRTIIANKCFQKLTLDKTHFSHRLFSNRFGGRLVMGISVALSSVSTMMIPITAELHYFIIIALRFLAGAGAVSFCLLFLYIHRTNHPVCNIRGFVKFGTGSLSDCSSKGASFRINANKNNFLFGTQN